VLGGQRHHERAVHVARHHHVGLETGPLAACARLKSKAVTLGTSSQPHRSYTTLLQSRLILPPGVSERVVRVRVRRRTTHVGALPIHRAGACQATAALSTARVAWLGGTRTDAEEHRPGTVEEGGIDEVALPPRA
jgi:hypothetical protein